MKAITEIQNEEDLSILEIGIDGGAGHLKLGRGKSSPAVVIWSFGGGWDHVSVSFSYRCPTWEEMCRVKDVFFHDEECVVQYHPPKSQYVNKHPYCLHLWRPIKAELPMPPKGFVG